VPEIHASENLPFLMLALGLGGIGTVLLFSGWVLFYRLTGKGGNPYPNIFFPGKDPWK
jgi:hypothetical protein